MSKTDKLIADAKTASREVKALAGGAIAILVTKRDGVIVWPDRTITRYGVDLSICTRMTIAQARNVLRLAA